MGSLRSFLRSPSSFLLSFFFLTSLTFLLSLFSSSLSHPSSFFLGAEAKNEDSSKTSAEGPEESDRHPSLSLSSSPSLSSGAEGTVNTTESPSSDSITLVDQGRKVSASSSSSPSSDEEKPTTTEKSVSASSSSSPSAPAGLQEEEEEPGLRLTEQQWKFAFSPAATAQQRKRGRLSLPPAPLPHHVKPEVLRIAHNPPRNFFQLKNLVPFSFYLPDRTGQFVAIVQGGKIDLSGLQSYSTDEIMEFVRFLASLYFAKMDGRRDAKMKVILDLGGLNVTSFLWNGGLSTLKAILAGLRELEPLLGETTSDFIIVNSSSVMKVIIQPIQLLIPSFVRLHVRQGPSDYQPYLRRMLGRAHLPIQYGGSSPFPLNDTPMAQAISTEVRELLRAKGRKL